MKCLSCGYTNEKNSTNCIICGNRLTNTKKVQNGKKKNIGTYIILILSLLLSINVAVSIDYYVDNIEVKVVDYIDCHITNNVEYCRPSYDIKLFNISKNFVNNVDKKKDDIKDLNSQDIKKYIHDNNIKIPISIAVFIISYLVLSIIYGLLYPIFLLFIVFVNTVRKSTKANI